MPRRSDVAQLNLLLTPAQFEAVNRAAAAQGMDKTAYIRSLLAEAIPDFPKDDFIQRGKYPRKKNP